MLLEEIPIFRDNDLVVSLSPLETALLLFALLEVRYLFVLSDAGDAFYDELIAKLHA